MLVDGVEDEDGVEANDVIPFTVVSEPNDDDNDENGGDAALDKSTTLSGDECEDLGCAFVRLKDILRTGRDIEDEEFPVYGSAEDSGGEKPVVGQLRVSVEGLATLRKVKAEMNAALTQTFPAGVEEESVHDKSRSLVQ